MRILATLLVALVLGAALAVAAVALLFSLRAPVAETGRVVATELPAPLVIDPSPLDDGRRQIRFVADADHHRTVSLEGTLPAGRTLRVLLVSRTGEGPLVHRAQPGADGRFRFPDLPAGSYELRVLDDAGAPYLPPRELALAADTTLDLAAAPGEVIFDVSLEGGAPLAKALVIVSRSGQVLAQGSTDERGRVTLAGLVPGEAEWRVWASGPDFAEPREWTGSTRITEDAPVLHLSLER